MPPHRDSIDGHNAKVFIENISNHNIDNDCDFLLSLIPTQPVKNILDVGFGTGAFLSSAKKKLQVDVVGVEKSRCLFEYTKPVRDNLNIVAYCEDFSNWVSHEKFDVIIMSFYLHHVADFSSHLGKALSMLNPSGRLIIMDRIALDEKAKDEFNEFWDKEYKAAHEWEEEKPKIFSREQLMTSAASNDFNQIDFYLVPTDTRKNTRNFPKTIAIIKNIADQQ